MGEVAMRSVRTMRLGPLPLVDHFLDRLGVPALLERFVPTTDPRCRLPYSKSLAVLLRSILVEREPIYRQQETVRGFAPGAFGLQGTEVELLHDDTIGRALDRLFLADRGALFTEVVVRAGQRFGIRLRELHQDTTSIRFTGQYRSARGRRVRGRRAPVPQSAGQPQSAVAFPSQSKDRLMPLWRVQALPGRQASGWNCAGIRGPEMGKAARIGLNW